MRLLSTELAISITEVSASGFFESIAFSFASQLVLFHLRALESRMTSIVIKNPQLDKNTNNF